MEEAFVTKHLSMCGGGGKEGSFQDIADYRFYHERQVRQMCAAHAMNMALESPRAAEEQWFELANSMERSADLQHARDDGYFSIQTVGKMCTILGFFLEDRQ